MAEDETEDDSAESGPEQPTVAIPLPRENPDLVGQGRAEAALLDAYLSGRLPHAWLLTGPRGIGKATLAYRFARFLLAQDVVTAPSLLTAPPTSLQVDLEAPAFRRVAAGGHADLLLIERGYDPRRKRRRSEIVVDDVRAIADFLHLTPAEGGWRIVIIDGADDMNRNAANALLKILEEPSARTLLLITSVSPGRLLPTIRSRCRHLSLDPLSKDDLFDLIKKYLPSLKLDEVNEAVTLAQGSIARALDLATSGGLELYREINAMLAALPALDGIALDRLADRLGRAGAEDSFRLLTEMLPGQVARQVRDQVGGQGGDDVASGLPARRSLDRWVEVWENLTRLFALVDVVNLDRKQAVLNAFFALEEASR